MHVVAAYNGRVARTIFKFGRLCNMNGWVLEQQFEELLIFWLASTGLLAAGLFFCVRAWVSVIWRG